MQKRSSTARVRLQHATSEAASLSAPAVPAMPNHTTTQRGRPEPHRLASCTRLGPQIGQPRQLRGAVPAPRTDCTQPSMGLVWRPGKSRAALGAHLGIHADAWRTTYYLSSNNSCHRRSARQPGLATLPLAARPGPLGMQRSGLCPPVHSHQQRARRAAAWRLQQQQQQQRTLLDCCSHTRDARHSTLLVPTLGYQTTSVATATSRAGGFLSLRA